MGKKRKTYYGAWSAFTIGTVGIVLLFFEKSHSIAPFLIGFGFSMGLMRLRGDD